MRDTYAVIARFPLDDVLVEIKDTQEQAESLAETLAAEPGLLRDISECLRAMGHDDASTPNPEDLGSVSVHRLLGGKIPVEQVSQFKT